MTEDYLLQLARSVMDRQLKVGGQRFAVRPPSVMEALQLFALSKGVRDGDEDDIEVWNQVLTRWLSAPVLDALCQLDAKLHVAVVMGLLRTGSPASGDEANAQAADVDDVPLVHWDVLINDYCQVYGAGSPWDVVRDTPWPFFMLMCRRLDQAKARANVWRLENDLIPHAGKEASNLMRQMRQRAGHIVEPGKKSKEALYRQSLDRLKSAFGNPSKRRNSADLKEK